MKQSDELKEKSMHENVDQGVSGQKSHDVDGSVTSVGVKADSKAQLRAERIAIQVNHSGSLMNTINIVSMSLDHIPSYHIS